MRALRDDVVVRVGEPPAPSRLLWTPEQEFPLGPIPGEVVAVGPEADPDVRVGMRVIYRGGSNAAVFEHGGETFARVQSRDISGVVED